MTKKKNPNTLKRDAAKVEALALHLLYNRMARDTTKLTDNDLNDIVAAAGAFYVKLNAITTVDLDTV